MLVLHAAYKNISLNFLPLVIYMFFFQFWQVWISHETVDTRLHIAQGIKRAIRSWAAALRVPHCRLVNGTMSYLVKSGGQPFDMLRLSM